MMPRVIPTIVPEQGPDSGIGQSKRRNAIEEPNLSQPKIGDKWHCVVFDDYTFELNTVVLGWPPFRIQRHLG